MNDDQIANFRKVFWLVLGIVGSFLFVIVGIPIILWDWLDCPTLVGALGMLVGFSAWLAFMVTIGFPYVGKELDKHGW